MNDIHPSINKNKFMRIFSIFLILLIGCSEDVKYWTETQSKYELKLPYFGNHDLNTPNSSFTRAVIVLHGAGGTAKGRYETILEMARTLGQESQTLIVSPHFRVTGNHVKGPLFRVHHNDVFTWQDDWAAGDLSDNNIFSPRPFQLSSFELTDNIVRRIDDNYFPNITNLVVVGNSGGGQFTNRYAAVNVIEPVVSMTMRYIITNPGSVFYLNNQRRVGTSLTTFAVPDSTNCPSYDDYKYGLSNKNTYALQTSNADIITNYGARDIIFFIGSNDNDPNGAGLPSNCRADFQGNHRLERAQVYHNHLRDVLGTDPVTAVIPGGTHGSESMWLTDCGYKYIFDTAASCTLQVGDF